MRVIIIRKNYLTKADYKFIKKQLKEKGFKVKDVATAINIKRRYLYDMFVGNVACSLDLLTFLDIHEIKTYYDGEVIE